MTQAAPVPGHFAHPADAPALELRGVTLRFAAQTALEGLSLQIDQGLRVAVVGPNGAGKSTLFNLLAGVMEPSEGEVRVHGHHPSRHVCIAYVTQSIQVDWNFPVTVQDVVMMGRVGLIGLLSNPRRLDWERVGQSLEQVKLSHLAQRQISELSGGQKQRMFIARALAQEADLLLLDEPLAGLDLTSQEQIMQLLDDLHQDGITVLFATHDLNLAADQFDRILLLNRRLVAYGPRDEVLTAHNLAEAYGGHVQVVDTADGTVMIGDMGGHLGHDDHEGPHG